MSFKHILLEFYQWCGFKMKGGKAKIKFIAVVCAFISAMLAIQYVNMKMMEQQYGNMGDFSSYGGMEQSADKQTFDSRKKEAGNSSEATNGEWSASDYGNPMEMMQPTWRTSAMIIAAILATAIIVAMGMYLWYRKMHMDSISPLVILQDEENEL